MGGDEDDLLASADEVRNLADPQDSLQALVSGISQLQAEIQTVNQQKNDAQQQEQTGEVLEDADDPYRLRTKGAVNAKEKQMSSMLLARPPATGVQDDMERLLIRLKQEIKGIETTLTAKMDRVEHQIKHLPDAHPPKDEEDVSGAGGPRSDAAASAYAESEDLDLYDSSVEVIGAPKENTMAPLASASFKKLKAASAMELVAKDVKTSDLGRTIWVRQLRSLTAELAASVRRALVSMPTVMWSNLYSDRFRAALVPVFVARLATFHLNTLRQRRISQKTSALGLSRLA